MTQEWETVLLDANSNMRDAIEVLEREKQGIVIVVDGNMRLVGTITDGDIRRALMHQQTTDTVLTKICNTEPVTIHVDDDQDVIAKIMKSEAINQLPIIDNDRIVIGLKVSQPASDLKFDNPVFLMAGGFGTRLMPLTESTPKPMLKVGDKPILETIIVEFIKQGFWNFYISTHYHSECITEYFEDGSRWGVSIQYVHEESPLGTAGALSLLPSSLNELPLILMNGDLLTKVNFKDVLYFHNSSKCESTVCVREYDFQVPFGVTNCEGNIVKNIIEKPVHKFYVNAGMYVLSRNVVESVIDDMYLDMPNLLNTLIKEKKVVSSYPVHEYWLDIGRLDDFSKAQIEVEGLFYD